MLSVTGENPEIQSKEALLDNSKLQHVIIPEIKITTCPDDDVMLTHDENENDDLHPNAAYCRGDNSHNSMFIPFGCFSSGGLVMDKEGGIAMSRSKMPPASKSPATRSALKAFAYIDSMNVLRNYSTVEEQFLKFVPGATAKV